MNSIRTILHADMDAFFASVEQLHHPEWRGRPVIVGSGPHERGVVSTCSYEARRFGVHSAMPSRTAYSLCPHAVFKKPDMALYEKTSEKVFEVFSRFSPYVEPVSIDEAFLDITGTLHLFDHDPVLLGGSLRTAMKESTGLTCSVGIAPNRLLSKIGSDQRKPDGLTLMPFDEGEIVRFLAPKPLGILWGVGRKTLELLKPYALDTCGDVQRLVRRDPEELKTILGSAAASILSDYCFGRDASPVNWIGSQEKSASREYTFKEDETSRDAIRSKLLALTGDVAHRFRRQSRWATTAHLKLRYADFTTITRQLRFDRPSRDVVSFRRAALQLFDNAAFEPQAVRLIGFGVSGIRYAPLDDPPALFRTREDERRRRDERLSVALDNLRDRGIEI